ncbi:hypothetical protein [Micromonospora marina]|uniref:hypothetical protein n=1 Tax=Micromonospora marina TaxID=307120 RepID=UPI0034549BB1
MSFTITHRGGEMEEGDLSAIPALVAELYGPVDHEHPDIAVSDDESGWMLSAFQSGRLVWENPDSDDEPRYMVDVSRSEISRIMSLVATGDLDDVDSLEWLPGYQ